LPPILLSLKPSPGLPKPAPGPQKPPPRPSPHENYEPPTSIEGITQLRKNRTGARTN